MKNGEARLRIIMLLPEMMLGDNNIIIIIMLAKTEINLR